MLESKLNGSKENKSWMLSAKLA